MPPTISRKFDAVAWLGLILYPADTRAQLVALRDAVFAYANVKPKAQSTATASETNCAEFWLLFERWMRASDAFLRRTALEIFVVCAKCKPLARRILPKLMPSCLRSDFTDEERRRTMRVILAAADRVDGGDGGDGGGDEGEWRAQKMRTIAKTLRTNDNDEATLIDEIFELLVENGDRALADPQTQSSFFALAAALVASSKQASWPTVQKQPNFVVFQRSRVLSLCVERFALVLKTALADIYVLLYESASVFFDGLCLFLRLCARCLAQDDETTKSETANDAPKSHLNRLHARLQTPFAFACRQLTSICARSRSSALRFSRAQACSRRREKRPNCSPRSLQSRICER